MKNLIIVLIFILSGCGLLVSDNKLQKITHVSGCHNGELIHPVIRMYSEPGGTKEVDKLLGMGDKDECKGSLVSLLETKVVNEKTYWKVKSFSTLKVGWINVD